MVYGKGQARAVKVECVEGRSTASSQQWELPGAGCPCPSAYDEPWLPLERLPEQGPMIEAFRAWQNFYLLTGATAATLTGLVFVAASLGANLKNSAQVTSGIPIFVTPTVIHFTTVLLVAMLCTIPTQTYASLSLLLACCGAAGLSYEGSTAVRLWRHHRHISSVDKADWLWRVSLPASGYSLILWPGIRLPKPTSQVLDILAIAVIAFVLLGIRNAWDLVLWIARQGLTSKPLE